MKAVIREDKVGVRKDGHLAALNGRTAGSFGVKKLVIDDQGQLRPGSNGDLCRVAVHARLRQIGACHPPTASLFSLGSSHSFSPPIPLQPVSPPDHSSFHLLPVRTTFSWHVRLYWHYFGRAPIGVELSFGLANCLFWNGVSGNSTPRASIDVYWPLLVTKTMLLHFSHLIAPK